MKINICLKLLFVCIFCLSNSAIFANNEANAVGCKGKIVAGNKVLRIAASNTITGQAIVKKLFVQNGSLVKKSDTIASLVGEDIAKIALDEANANLKNAKIALDDANLALQEAIINQNQAIEEVQGSYDDIENVIVDKSPPRQEKEQLLFEQKGLIRKLNQLKAIKPILEKRASFALERAKITYDIASLAAKKAQENLDLYYVKAPIDGRILHINSNEGENVSLGGVCDLGNTQEIMVDAEVYISDIRKIKKGDKAQITGDGFDGEVAGVVESLGYQVKKASASQDAFDFADKKVVNVKIKLENIDTNKFESIVNSNVSCRIFLSK